jgi:hypothetical protein
VTKKSAQDEQMEEAMMRVKGMIEKSMQAECWMVEKRLNEERAKADAKLAREKVQACERLIIVNKEMDLLKKANEASFFK